MSQDNNQYNSSQQNTSQPQYQQPNQQPVINIINQNTNTNIVGGGTGVSPKSKVVAILLCIFLGYLGVHRFYAGKIGTGVLMFLTVGGFGIWTLIDLIVIILGNFTDSAGLRIVN